MNTRGNVHINRFKALCNRRESKKTGKLPCIIKDATKQEQEVQGLIENVHREDLTPIEKGRKAYSIFQLYGIDLPSRQLAKTAQTIGTRKYKGLREAASPDEETINNVPNFFQVNWFYLDLNFQHVVHQMYY